MNCVVVVIAPVHTINFSALSSIVQGKTYNIVVIFIFLYWLALLCVDSSNNVLNHKPMNPILAKYNLFCESSQYSSERGVILLFLGKTQERFIKKSIFPHREKYEWNPEWHLVAKKEDACWLKTHWPTKQKKHQGDDWCSNLYPTIIVCQCLDERVMANCQQSSWVLSFG